MNITENLDGIVIKSRDGLRPILAFYYSATPNTDMIVDTLRFMSVGVGAVYFSRKGEKVINVALKNEEDIDTVIASLNVPFRERRLRRY